MAEDGSTLEALREAEREARAMLGETKPEDLAAETGEDKAPEPSTEVVEPEPAKEERPAEEPPVAAAEEKPKEEAAEAAPPEPTPEKPQQADTQEEDPEHFWNQYRDDDARKKGMFETKRYAAEMSKRARKTESELAETRRELEELRGKQQQPPSEPSPPAPKAEAAPPTPNRFDQVFKLLWDRQDPDVRRDVQEIGEVRKERDACVARMETLYKDRQAKAADIAKAEALIEHYEGLAKENPESEEFAKYLERLEVKRARQLGEQSSKDAELVQLRYYADSLQYRHNELGNAIQARVRDYDAEEAKRAEESKTYNQNRDEVIKEFNTAFERYCAQHGISDEEEKEDTRNLFGPAATMDADKIDDFFLWMNSPDGQDALLPLRRAKQRGAASYAKVKREDAKQTHGNPPPSPKEKEEVTEKPSVRQSYEDESKRAERQLKEELARAFQ